METGAGRRSKTGQPAPTTDQRVVDALREYRRKHGCSPTTTSWKAEGGLPAAETIIRHCGSWRAAIELAELPVLGAGRSQVQILSPRSTKYLQRSRFSAGQDKRRRGSLVSRCL
jgi:Homing endonuclease associated repeat